MAKDTTTDSQTLPFGTIEESASSRKKAGSKKKAPAEKSAAKKAATKKTATKKAAAKKAAAKKAAKKVTQKKGATKKAAIKKSTSKKTTPKEAEVAAQAQAEPQVALLAEAPVIEAERGEASLEAAETVSGGGAVEGEDSSPQGGAEEGGGRRKRRRKRRRGRGRNSAAGENRSEERADGGKPDGKSRGKRKDKQRSDKQHSSKQSSDKQRIDQVATGMFVIDKGGIGVLRREEHSWCPSKEDIYLSKGLIQANKLREGSLVTGRIARGQKHKYQLVEVQTVDGKSPKEWAGRLSFKNLTSIDPDFHYAVGDVTGDVSMRIVDLLCPIGRGQRGLIVAPPRSGKTTLLRSFARGIELGYPDVHLMVLLVDERPEEATEWRRSVEHGQVFVSTSDETAKRHIQLAEAVWKRACRLVEMGEDVVLLLDSITRLARAYNNQAGSGRTMSGGLDSRAMERPRKIFGSARNTVEAGSLTILGTTLVDTGSRMDNMVFEEFKGTGNMELVLNRKLADRRIFPAIDVEKAGTRKEEKLVGMRRLKLLHTLRRVLTRMSFIEAMELLITRLEDVEKTDDFLARFEIDPEA